MRIHHLNCGTDCPLGGALFDGCSHGLLGHLVCHCLLIETDDHGLVLVDTGYGLKDVALPHRRPDPRITLAWRAMLNIRLREQETAIRQIEALGHDPRDVRHIVLTHLDFDHAGGLEDFPNATVHVMQREYDDAAAPHAGIIARHRWRSRQWDGVTRWQRHSASGEPWFGFDAVRDLPGLPPEILLVPLPEDDIDTDAFTALAGWARGLYGDSAWLAVELHRGPDDDARLARLQALAATLGLPAVASGDVHMHVRGRRALQDALTAVRLRRPLAECGGDLFPNGERHLRPREVLAGLYPEALLRESAAIAARSSAGILTSNQRATGARAGWARSRSSSTQTRGMRSR